MNNYVIWLDSKLAEIFALKTSGIAKTQLKKSDIDHHRRHKKDIHVDSNSEHYFRDLAEKMKDADQILILGPGMAKSHFTHYLETHQAKTLSKKVIGVENLEQVSEKQILATARKFFKHYDMFNSPN